MATQHVFLVSPNTDIITPDGNWCEFAGILPRVFSTSEAAEVYTTLATQEMCVRAQLDQFHFKNAFWISKMKVDQEYTTHIFDFLSRHLDTDME